MQLQIFLLFIYIFFIFVAPINCSSSFEILFCNKERFRRVFINHETQKDDENYIFIHFSAGTCLFRKFSSLSTALFKMRTKLWEK